MAYIAPNGNIKIFHDIPLDNTYQHTLRFSDVAHQTAYFSASSRIKASFTAQYYTRLNRGVIRVNALADNLYDCNYVAYQNTSFGNKWFYAFISSVEYVNNAVTEIHFEIDVMQTWYFDFQLLPCFVERMHSTSDAIGDNIVPESVERGEYIYNDQGRIDGTQRHAIVVATVNTQNQTVNGQIYGRIYGGLTLRAFASQDAASVNAYIATFLAQPDAVCSMYMVPEILITDGPLQPGGGGPDPSEYGEALDSTNTLNTPVVKNDIQGISIQDALEDYVPHNHKLYTYPFNYLMLFDTTGKSLTLRYEFFDQLKPVIEIGGSITLPVTLIARPRNYKNQTNAVMGETLSTANYPLCSWNVDSYAAWVAQNAVSYGIQAGGMAIGAAATALMNPIAGVVGVGSAVHQVTNIMQQSYQASIAADQIRGNQQSGNADFSMGYMGIWSARMSVTSQFARMIDSYFDMFGYAQKKVMQPVRKARQIWTYVKTIGCVIEGSVPADDANKICKLHDNGITYWDVENNPNITVGNYMLGASNIPVL